MTASAIAGQPGNRGVDWVGILLLLLVAALWLTGCAKAAPVEPSRALARSYIRAWPKACGGPCEVTLTYAPRLSPDAAPARLVWACPENRTEMDAQASERSWTVRCKFTRSGEWQTRVVLVGEDGEVIDMAELRQPVRIGAVR
jgi:hypothetical protein